MQHLGRADAVDDLAARCASRISSHVACAMCSPALTRRRAARPAGRRARTARICLYAVGAVARTVTPCSATRSASCDRGGRLGEEGARAGAQREDDEHAEPEGEGERRGAGDHVGRLEPQHVAAEGVVDGQHVAVEVRGDLGDAGAAGRRAEQGDVVGGGVDGGEVGRLRRRRAGSGRRRRRRRRARRRGRGPTVSRTVVRRRRRSGGRPARRRAGSSRRSASSSRARSAAIVVTTTPPALSTPSQAATVHGLLGERSSTRLPGTRPRSSTSTCATWLARSQQLAVGPHRRRPGVRSAGRSAPCSAMTASSSSTAGVEPLGVLQRGRGELQRRPLVGRRQVVAGEGVDVAASGTSVRAHASASGRRGSCPPGRRSRQVLAVGGEEAADGRRRGRPRPTTASCA